MINYIYNLENLYEYEIPYDYSYRLFTFPKAAAKFAQGSLQFPSQALWKHGPRKATGKHAMCLNVEKYLFHMKARK